ncbi:hypothetical protein OE88DRAFT_1605070, partial [Heliocybe sulcata]
WPKGLSKKLLPKWLGPYRIERDFGNNSYKLELSAHLRSHGVHNAFHASLLRIHLPNDDRLFPGRLDSQVILTDEHVASLEPEWAVDRIIAHKGKGTAATFELVWHSGDHTWLPYKEIAHLAPLQAYFDAVGI